MLNVEMAIKINIFMVDGFYWVFLVLMQAWLYEGSRYVLTL